VKLGNEIHDKDCAMDQELDRKLKALTPDALRELIVQQYRDLDRLRERVDQQHAAYRDQLARLRSELERLREFGRTVLGVEDESKPTTTLQ
jgi:hypothetical protein